LVKLFRAADITLGCISYCGITAASMAPARAARPAQRDHRLVNVAASSGGVHLSRDVAPGFALAALGRRARMQRTFAAD